MRIKALVPLLSVAAACAVAISSCTFAYGPSFPSGENWAVVTKMAIDNFGGPANDPERGVFSYYMWDEAGAAGESTSPLQGWTSYPDGVLYAGNRRYNARWHMAETDGQCDGIFQEGTVLYQVAVALVCYVGDFYSSYNNGYSIN